MTGSDFGPGYGYRTIIVHDVLFEITLADAGDTAVITIGLGTIVDPTATATGVTVTVVDADHFLEDADVTWTAAAFYGPTTSTGTFWLHAAAAHTYVENLRTIVPDDTTPTCVVAYLSGSSDPVSCAFHMLISGVPAVR